MLYLFYTNYISVALTHYGIFHAKFGEDGIMDLLTGNTF